MVKAKNRLGKIISDPRLSIEKSLPGVSIKNLNSKHETPKEDNY
jgi:hypothetical protein